MPTYYKLPHPHGFASTGDMFYPGFPKVVFNDLPGTEGSRAIEFGEDGTGASANRMGYALSKNLKYVWSALTAKQAKQKMVKITPGAPINEYVFTDDDVWVGDLDGFLAGNPGGETQAHRCRLIAILDENFHEATNSDGDRFIPYVIDDGAAASVVGDLAGVGDGDGFFSQPRVQFGTQIPFPVSGTPVTGPAALPAGTWYLVYAKGERLEALTDQSLHSGGTDVPHLMRDLGYATGGSMGLLRAGVFLTDGSRKMRGPVDLASYGLRDQYATTTVPLAEVNTAVIRGTANTSILGVMDSHGRHIESVMANRMVGGSITWTAGAGAEKIGTSGVVAFMNGEYVRVPDKDITPTNDAEMFLVAPAGGLDPVERTPGNVLATDVPLAHYKYDGTGDTYLYLRALNFAAAKAMNVRELTVGDRTGCDFPGTGAGLQAAIDYIDAISSIVAGGGNSPHSATIRVHGFIVTAAEISVDLKTTAASRPTIRIVGDGATIVTTLTSGNVIDCKTNRVEIQGITFSYLGASAHNAAKAAIMDMGSLSSVRDCAFTKSGSYGFANCIMWTTAMASPASGVVVKDIDAQYVTAGVIIGSEAAFAAGDEHVIDSLFENIHVSNINTSTPAWGLVVPGKRNVVRGLKITDNGIVWAAVVLGAGGVAEDCYLTMGSGSPSAASGIAIKPHMETEAIKIDIHNVTVLYAANGVTGAHADASTAPLVEISGCRFSVCTKGVSLENTLAPTASSARVTDCEFIGIGGIYMTKQYHARLRGNTFTLMTGAAVVMADTYFVAAENELSYGTGASDYAIHVKAGCDRSVIKSNDFASTAGPTNGQVYLQSDRVKFSGNTVGDGSVSAKVMVLVEGNHARFTGNTFLNGTAGAVKVDGNATTISYVNFEDNTFDTMSTVAAIDLINIAYPSIRGGVFISCGLAIYGHEAGTGGIGDILVEGVRFVGCGDVAILSMAAVIVSDRTIAAGDNHPKIRGCEFIGIGGELTEDKYAVYINKRGTVSGCHFTGLVGHASASDKAWLVRIRENGVIRGNTVEVDPGSSIFPETFVGFEAEKKFSSFSGNQIDLTPSGAPTRPTLIAAIKGSSEGFCTFIDNVFPGFDGASGGTAWAIQSQGDKNIMSENDVGDQSGAQATLYGIRATGVNSITSLNRIESTDAIDSDAVFAAVLSHRTIQFAHDTAAAGWLDEDIPRAGTTTVMRAVAERPGSIVGLAVGLRTAVAAGTITVTARVNDVSTTAEVIMTSGLTKHTAIDPNAGSVFDAGDYITVICTTTAGFTTPNALAADVIVRYDKGEEANQVD